MKSRLVICRLIEWVVWAAAGSLSVLTGFTELSMVIKAVMIIGLIGAAAGISCGLFDMSCKWQEAEKNQMKRSYNNNSMMSSNVRTDMDARVNRANSNQVQQSNSAKVQSAGSQSNKVASKAKTQQTKNITKLVLLNEEGTALFEWSLQGKTAVSIGKSTDKEPVDIDLNDSAFAQMISKQHAVLNYTDGGWYIDDIDSKNGTRVKKLNQNAILDLKLVGAVEVSVGDIIYIANTMLQLR